MESDPTPWAGRPHKDWPMIPALRHSIMRPTYAETCRQHLVEHWLEFEEDTQVRAVIDVLRRATETKRGSIYGAGLEWLSWVRWAWARLSAEQRGEVMAGVRCKALVEQAVLAHEADDHPQ